MTTFLDNQIPSRFKDVKEVNIGGIRHYKLGNECYPSVTTVLGALPKPEQLQKWIDKVGTLEAERIKNDSADRGQAMHGYIEDYLCGCIELNGTGITFHPGYFMAKDLKPYLDRIDNIHCLETPLFSSKFKLAGRVDCIAEYDGVLSIIDFKNARKLRTSDMITNYFMQTTAYAGLYEDMTNIRVDQIVLLMAVENKAPQVFIKNPKNYIKPLVAAIKNYNKQVEQFKGLLEDANISSQQ